MSRTTKPCPGCGQVDRYRPANEVCQTCRKKLNRVAEVEAELARVQATVAATQSIETKPRAVYIPDRCYMVAAHRALYESVEYQQFTEATVGMIKALLAPLDRGRVIDQRYGLGYTAIPAKTDYNIGDHGAFVEASDEGVKAAQAWWKALERWSQVCYGVGVNDGRDLLAQLAASTLTVDQVNERAFEMVHRRRMP